MKDNISLWFGWTGVIIGLAALAFVVFALIMQYLGEPIITHGMIYVRAGICIPFLLWWGIRQINKAKVTDNDNW